MKKHLLLIMTVSLLCGACERHPASQLQKEDETAAKAESATSGQKQKQTATPEASPTGTPKTFFPRNP
jgi:hypothetical protein